MGAESTPAHFGLAASSPAQDGLPQVELGLVAGQAGQPSAGRSPEHLVSFVGPTVASLSAPRKPPAEAAATVELIQVLAMCQ